MTITTVYTRENPPPDELALERIRKNHCPFCGHEEVQCDGAAEVSMGMAYQEVYCERGEDEKGPECGHWQEVYALKRWEP